MGAARSARCRQCLCVDMGSGRAERRAALSFRIEPGKKELLQLSPERAGRARLRPGPMTASRVRLWAESETGERWLDYRDQDLWLVERNPR